MIVHVEFGANDLRTEVERASIVSDALDREAFKFMLQFRLRTKWGGRRVCGGFANDRSDTYDNRLNL